MRFGSAVLLGLLAGAPLHAEENCGGWRAPDTDASHGKYELELRVCDLPYGLSAYIQVRNSSAERVALSYRLLMKDRSQKDSDTVLDAGATLRTETCQSCAKRYIGLEGWEVLSAKGLGKPAGAAAAQAAIEPPPATTTENAPKSAALAEPKAAAKPPEPPRELPASSDTEAASRKPEVLPVRPEPVRTAEPPARKPAENAAPAAASGKGEGRKTEVDGFRAEDGTIIPWDQLPPEFRPRK